MDKPPSEAASGRVVEAGRVRPGGAPVKVPVPGQPDCDGPTLELVREGEVVRALDITCSCGQRLRVVCEY